MRPAASFVLVAAAASFGAAGGAGSWLEILPAGRDADIQVAVDLSTVQDNGFGLEMALRVRTPTPRRHPQGFEFGSFLATVRVDCENRRLLPIAVSYFVAKEPQVAIAHETNLSVAGVLPDLLDVVDPAAKDALLRAGCAGKQ